MTRTIFVLASLEGDREGERATDTRAFSGTACGGVSDSAGERRRERESERARSSDNAGGGARRPEEEVLSIDAEGGVTTTTKATTEPTEEPERPEEPHPEEGEGAGG